MSNLGELVRNKVAEIETDESKIVMRALAVAYVADCLENHADDMTVAEYQDGVKKSFDTCTKMQDNGIQLTGFDLFIAALKILES